MPAERLSADVINQISADLPDDAILSQTGESLPEPPQPSEQPTEPIPEASSAEGMGVAAEPEAEPTSVEQPPSHTLTQDQWNEYEYFHSIDQRLRNDPQFAQRFQSAVQDQPTQPSPVSIPEPAPEPALPFDEFTDPQYKALYDRVLAQGEVINRLDAYFNRQSQIEAQAATQRARDEFQQRYSLTPEQTNQYYNNAQLWGASAQSLLASGRDAHTALSMILDATAWSDEAFRNRYIQAEAQRQLEDQDRKAKAGSLSGTSGSMPRTAPAPQNESERRDAIITAIREGITE